jgi:hypothetical protein
LAVLNLRGFEGRENRHIWNGPSFWERRERHKKSMILKEKQAKSYKTNNEKRKLRQMKTVKHTAAKGCWESK